MWRELLSSAVGPWLCHDPFTKTFPLQKASRASSPLLESSSIRSWGGDGPSVWSPPLPTRQALRAVPAGQLLLLPPRKPFTPQHISKLTNYNVSLAGKHAFPAFHRVPGRAGAGRKSPLHQTQKSSSETREKEPQRMGWAGLRASDVLCLGTERDWAAGTLSCTLAGTS